MQNRFEKFDAAFYQEIMLSSGVFRRETASGFYPWCNVVSPRKRVAEGLCGWRHGKLVSNAAKRTVAPPNAKHSTLLQGCFFMFLFLILFTIWQQCTIYPQGIFYWTKFMSKIFFIIKKMRFFYIFCRFCWIFSFSCVYLRYLFKVNQPANVPTWCHIEGGYRRWKRDTGKIKAFYW